MQTKLLKLMLAIMLSFGFFAISVDAGASCVWTHGYWSHGVYHHSHKVCNGAPRHHCRWVGGYRKNGVWHPSHKVCN